MSSSEEVTINNEGSNTFTLNCSANGATSGSASVQVTGVVNRINITNEIFLIGVLIVQIMQIIMVQVLEI